MIYLLLFFFANLTQTHFLPKTSEKTTAPHSGAKDSDQLTRTNLSFMGSTVETGSGLVVVLLTGPRTYFGQNAKLLTADRGETAFAVGVRRVSYTLVGFMAVMVPCVLLVSGFVQQDWTQAVLFSIAVAVGLTPVSRGGGEAMNLSIIIFLLLSKNNNNDPLCSHPLQLTR